MSSPDHPLSPPPLWREVALVAIGGAIVGILTSLGQTVLPFGLSPLANSAGSWSLAAFLLALVNREPRHGPIIGFVALATMLVGYFVTSEVRGFAVGPRLLLFWGAASLVVGPVLGVGAAWTRGTDPTRVAAGVALIAGILIGEGVYGLTVVAETTPAGYWIGQIVVGLAIAAAVSVRRLGSLRPAILCAVLTAAVAATFYVGYSGNLLAFL